MNAHEANREAMASDMAEALWRAMAPADRTHGMVRALHDADPDYRMLVARQTGREHMPSDETWNRALSLLEWCVKGWLDRGWAA